MRHLPTPADSGPRRTAPLSRPAYTLTELMIVLAILAAVAGISWPMLMRPWSRSLAQQAAQQLTGQLLDARTRAVEQSRVYRLRWRPGTGEFQIDAPGAEVAPTDGLTPPRPVRDEPDPGRPDPGNSDMPATPGERPPLALAGTSAVPTTDEPPPPPARRIVEQLPRGVRFPAAPPSAPSANDLGPAAASPEIRDAATSLFDALPAARDEAVESLANSLPDPWSDPVWFYPDGRTSNAKWTLVSEEGYEVAIALRGLTGTVRIGPVRPLPQPAEGDELTPESADQAVAPRDGNALPTAPREPAQGEF